MFLSTVWGRRRFRDNKSSQPRPRRPHGQGHLWPCENPNTKWCWRPPGRAWPSLFSVFTAHTALATAFCLAALRRARSPATWLSWGPVIGGHCPCSSVRLNRSPENTGYIKCQLQTNKKYKMKFPPFKKAYCLTSYYLYLYKMATVYRNLKIK